MSKVTVTVNGLTLIHRDSGATSTATVPDVCATPPSLAPTPYPNLALASDLARGTSSVRIDGDQPVAVAGSVFARSSGDEAGTGGGVTSGTTAAEAALLSHSFDVDIEGRGAARLTDKMLHNHGNAIDSSGIHARLPDAAAGGRLLFDKSTGKIPKKRPAREIVNFLPGVDTNLGDYIDPKTGTWPSSIPPNPSKGWPKDKAWPPVPIDGKRPVLNAAWLAQPPRNVKFVGRYLSLDAGKHFPLDAAEIKHLHRAGMKIVFIWESHKYRAISGGNVERATEMGKADAAAADRKLEEIGVKNTKRPVYYTCDFQTKAASDATAKGLVWSDLAPKKHLDKTGHHVHDRATVRDLVHAYFDGIKQHYHGSIERIGAYGAHLTIQSLFDRHAIRWGWQFAFPPVPDLTVDYPWGPTGPDPKKIEMRCHLLQYVIMPLPDYAAADTHVTGPGSLDLDAAIKKDYGGF